METNFVGIKVISVKEGRREKVLVDKAFSTDEEEVMDSVNKTIYESIKSLTGNKCLFIKERISSIAGGNSVIYVDLESPKFGDFILTAKCCNGNEIVESQRGFALETFKDYDEFFKIIADASGLVLSEIVEKMSEKMFDSLKLDKGFEIESLLSKTKEEL